MSNTLRVSVPVHAGAISFRATAPEPFEVIPYSIFTNQEQTLIAQAAEPRFTCNVYMQEYGQAYEVLKDFASIFRALDFWIGGKSMIIGDRKEKPTAIFTNSNVKDGVFNYSSTSKKARYNVVKVRYNNKDNFYETELVQAEDIDSIIKYGIREKELTAFGCTSKYQAERLAKYVLYSENYFTEMVTFSTSLEGHIVYPGTIISIFDQNRSKVFQGGRAIAAQNISSGTNITLDRELFLAEPWGHNKQVFKGQKVFAYTNINGKVESHSGANVVISVENDLEYYPQNFFKGKTIILNSQSYSIQSSQFHSDKNISITLDRSYHGGNVPVNSPQNYSYYEARFDFVTSQGDLEVKFEEDQRWRRLAAEHNINHGWYREGDIVYNNSLIYYRCLRDNVDLISTTESWMPLLKCPHFNLYITDPSEILQIEQVKNSSDTDTIFNSQVDIMSIEAPLIEGVAKIVPVRENQSEYFEEIENSTFSNQFSLIKSPPFFFEKTFNGQFRFEIDGAQSWIEIRDLKILYEDGEVIYLNNLNTENDWNGISPTINSGATRIEQSSAYHFSLARRFRIESYRKFTIQAEFRSNATSQVAILAVDDRANFDVNMRTWIADPRDLYKTKNWRVLTMKEGEFPECQIEAIEYDSSIYDLIELAKVDY